MNNMNLRAKLQIYDADTDEVVDQFDTYVVIHEYARVKSPSFEMVEMELGSLERRLNKKLQWNLKKNSKTS